MRWENKPIGEFCKTGSGGTPSRKQLERFYGGGIPWVKSGELREAIIFETEETITETALKETSAKLIPPDALLVAMYGATVGRVAILGIEASSNQAVCHIVPDQKIADQRYMFYALRRNVPRWLNQRVGGAQPNINQNIIRNTRIPLPALEEQKRIAAILDKADSIRRKRKDAIALTEELLRSTFLDMFGDPVTNPKGWEEVYLGEISKVQGGLQVTSKRKNNPMEIPYLRVANVYRDRLVLDEIKTIRVTEQEAQRTYLQTGDILIVEGHGNSTEIGRSSVWNGSIPNCTHQNHLIRVRIDTEKAESIYISTFLNSPGGRRQLHKFGKTTSGLNTISTSNIKATKVLITPLS
ncbi:MAG: restriction endonuclease subunit S [Moorea sp. SIO2I5]|nr:restriction endonuclease subunit S [Moorena sp. SIO2I5]